jgi:single-stranded-DNA-specific exonuclease
MQRRLPEKDQTRLLLSFMKVVAIATIADAVPLTGENRVFARLGLDALRRAVNPGLKALLEVAQISNQRPPSSSEVAFRIAPRINAAGRMDIARDVIELFSVKDSDRARLLAGKLDHLNAERQEEERRILRSIDERIAGDPALCEAYCIVIDGEGWHRGVIGIAATRIVERYHRPALVISRDGEEAHGSGRSIRPFHLLEAVESSSNLFTRYGGHSHACGFAMPSANVARLGAELDAFARTRLTASDFDPVLDVEAELDLTEITPALFQMLSLLEPYGAGNHEPVFRARNVRLIAPPKILKDKHIKLKLKAKGNAGGEELRTEKRELRSVFDAIGWNMAERLQQSPLLAGDAIDIAFTIGHNDHPDFGGLELSLRDFKISLPETLSDAPIRAKKPVPVAPQ